MAIFDTFTRYVPVIEVRERFTGTDVVVVPEEICKEIGFPRLIRLDQGSEFISKDLDLWAYASNFELDFSRPGKPTDNAYIENLNGKFRAECIGY